MRGAEGEESEAEDEAGGEARLVLRAGIEAGEQIVELDGAERNEGSNFDVDAGTESGGEGVGANRAEGFVSATHQKMDERGDGAGEGDLGAEEIGLKMRAGTEKRAVVAAEVGGEADPGTGFVGSGKFPAVQVGMIRGSDEGTNGTRAFHGRDYRDGSANVGVAAEELEAVLSAGLRKSKGESTAEGEKKK